MLSIFVPAKKRKNKMYIGLIYLAKLMSSFRDEENCV